MKKLLLLLAFFSITQLLMSQNRDDLYRPKIHFYPPKNWMNDPNGMVYHNGVYHLFYQHHPASNVWGPMHWGHAVSKDMVHWEHKPIAIYPDSIGTIFSGSAVVDKDNTSGFGKNGIVPLVAIFTQHNQHRADAGTSDFQNQSIAYSLDNGETWTKYSGNPVLRTPGIKDFRDPKVFWHEGTKKWIMTLAVVNTIHFYSSPNLKDWTKESEFGKDLGAHGGVWECPDLFSMNFEGKEQWVLLVNLNPGGPNGGSATQYFIGAFDGLEFKTTQKEVLWADYGPDEYAGVTWSNTGNKRYFIGWMSNWNYANQVPTSAWRSAFTLTRELNLLKTDQGLRLRSLPVNDYVLIREKGNVLMNQNLEKGIEINLQSQAYRLEIRQEDLKDLRIVLSNAKGEELVIGYDLGKSEYFIDRTKAGVSDFNADFAKRFTAPRFFTRKAGYLELYLDATSVELFADRGATVMTTCFFPTGVYTQMRISGKGTANHVEWQELKSIWK